MSGYIGITVTKEEIEDAIRKGIEPKVFAEMLQKRLYMAERDYYAQLVVDWLEGKLKI